VLLLSPNRDERNSMTSAVRYEVRPNDSAIPEFDSPDAIAIADALEFIRNQGPN
jgi:hypothetical protein